MEKIPLSIPCYIVLISDKSNSSMISKIKLNWDIIKQSLKVKANKWMNLTVYKVGDITT